MKRQLAWALLGGVLLIGACDTLPLLFLPSTVRVLFVNQSPDFNVEATIFTDEDEDILELLLTTLGDEDIITVGAGQTVSRVFQCDEIGALMLEDAALQSPLLQPDTNTGIFRQGDDFACGGTVTFTFTHSALLVDFAVSTLLQ